MPAKNQPQQNRLPKAPPPKASQPVSVWDQESDDSPWEDVVPPVTAQQRLNRVVLRYTRVVRRLLWAVAVGAKTRVLRSWQRQAIADDQRESQLQDPPTCKKAAAKKKPRRDDLSFVGKPMPPTNRAFPISRDWCNHLTDQKGLTSPSNPSLLQANGGRAGTRLIYWWTCAGCGSRWQRISEEEYCFGPTSNTTAASSSGPIRPSAPIPDAAASQPDPRDPTVCPEFPLGLAAAQAAVEETNRMVRPVPNQFQGQVINLIDEDVVTEIQTDEEMADPGLRHR